MLITITDDVLNVRLQTLGVIEHSFPINLGGMMYEWRLYDVGGAVSNNPFRRHPK
jgi:guanine nucleotide-binding protein G(i) subunit alpha